MGHCAPEGVMKYLFSYVLLAFAFVVPSTQAEAQLFGEHSEMQWLEGEVSLFDPLTIIEEEGKAIGVEGSLTYVYTKLHSNVHIVGTLRYLHPLQGTDMSHRVAAGGLRLYKWGGYVQGVVGQIDGGWDGIVSAGYYVTPKIGVRANWFAGAEMEKAGHVTAGLVWRF